MPPENGAKMRNSSSRCTQQTARSAVINDFTITQCQAGNITILATRIFDGVQSRMDSTQCTVTLPEDIRPASLISAYSTDQKAWAENVYISDYNERYQLVECTVNCPGRVIYTDLQGAEQIAYCTISIPYSALMSFPDDALLPAFLSCLCSVSVFSFSQGPVSASSFNAYCSGALAVFTASYLPVQLNGSRQFYPDDIACRRACATPTNSTRQVFTNTGSGLDSSCSCSR